MRDLLIEHIDGPVLVSKKIGYDRGRPKAVQAAIATKLLVYEPPNTPRPKRTRITDRGREELARALGEWADAIVRAQKLTSDILASPTFAALLQAVPRKVPEPREAAFSEDVAGG